MRLKVAAASFGLRAGLFYFFFQHACKNLGNQRNFSFLFSAVTSWEAQLRVMFGSCHWTLPDLRSFEASEMLALSGLAAAACTALAFAAFVLISRRRA
jgi:hypothetical protein